MVTFINFSTHLSLLGCAPIIFGILRISIELAAFLVLFSIEKAAISMEIRSKTHLSELDVPAGCGVAALCLSK